MERVSGDWTIDVFGLFWCVFWLFVWTLLDALCLEVVSFAGDCYLFMYPKQALLGSSV